MPGRISIVLPIRNREKEIAVRVDNLITGLETLVSEVPEIILVDDGSRDGTADICQRLVHRYKNIRYLRHDRPRGMEAAGQTGLERASSDLVFVQERDADFCFTDLKHLLQLAGDDTIVAARAESLRGQVSPSLIRRVRLWGMTQDDSIRLASQSSETCGLQMIRRTNLQRLTGPNAKQYRLEGKSKRMVTLQRAHRQLTSRRLKSEN
ncbi:glycosyltransferase [Stieleria sp. JC731]|uniref:glycosyltransferase family 2 protein n=1 Tax=Pirellulaceae TaxID=2691357 RepID=UPI001E41FEA3|nr:glycosyltransferase [Stieleria sp. JC731]MCC9602192.1 glycosyltransferase [Stieleria sp. JC731]